MKKIICFGDSNTYGYNPISGTRYNENIRWTGLLKNFLNDDWDLIEEGCNNRTGIFENECGLIQTGSKYLPICLSKHSDINTIIIGLGANDLQKFYDHTEANIEKGIFGLINCIREFDNDIRIILMAPAKLSNEILTGVFSFQFDEDSIKQSREMSKIYKRVAEQENCELICLDDIVKVSKIDGLHFDINSHKTIAEYISAYLK